MKNTQKQKKAGKMKKPVKKKEKVKLHELLNPANLRKEIDSYGYEFSLGKYSILIAVICGGVAALGMFFSLNWKYTAVIILFFLALLPGIILDAYRNMYEHKRFLDMSDYMEQILYSFKNSQKILTALKDTASLPFRGKMRQTVQKAADYIEAGAVQEEGKLYQEAFAVIEKEYPNRRLAAIHKFLLSAEKNGGDNTDSVELLLKDKNIWADNVLVLQEERRSRKNLVFAALLLTVAFAAIFQGIYRVMPPEYGIVNSSVMQTAAAIYLMVDIWIFRKANQEIAKSWIAEEENPEEERFIRYYHDVMGYDEKKERKLSRMLGIPVLIIAGILFLIEFKIASAVAAVIAVFLLNQHKIGYRTAYNRVVKEINRAFPQWLMQMALLLQTNNVRRAISQSAEEAPAILRPALQELSQKLMEEPDSPELFNSFLEKFELSSIQSAMQMLYSMSTLGSGEVKTQIRALIERNSSLLDKTEKLKNEEKLTKIVTLFYAPQLTISAYLMVGMVMFILVFLQKSIS